MSLHFEGWTTHTPPEGVSRVTAAADQAARSSNMLLRLEDKLQAAYEANHHQHDLWQLADFRDADATSRPDIRRELRAYNRYEVANNAIVSRVTETYVDDVFGSPSPVLQVESGNNDLNRLVEAGWQRWCRAMNYWSTARVLFRARVVDGEGLGVRSWSRRATQVRMRVLDLEVDRLAAPNAQLDHLEHYIDGVSLDPVTKEPTQYDVLTTHPGNEYFDALPGGFTAVPYAAELVLHVFRQLRAEQHRGICDAAPILPLSGLMRKFLTGSVSKTTLEAAFSFVIKSMAAPETEDGDDGDSLWSTVSLPRSSGLGMMLPDGYDIQQLTSQGTTQSIQAMIDVFGLLYASVFRMPVGRATGRYMTSGYAPIRAELKPYQNGLDKEREQVLEPLLLTPTYLWFLQEFRETAEYKAVAQSGDDPEQHRWQFAPPELIVDPSREGEAQRKDMAAGLALRSDNMHMGDLDRRDELAAKEWGFPDMAAYRQACAGAVFNSGKAPDAKPSGKPEPPAVKPDAQADVQAAIATLSDQVAQLTAMLTAPLHACADQATCPQCAKKKCLASAEDDEEFPIGFVITWLDDLDKAELGIEDDLQANCGTGKGGFQSGNSCAKGRGFGRGSTLVGSRGKREVITGRNGDRLTVKNEKTGKTRTVSLDDLRAAKKAGKISVEPATPPKKKQSQNKKKPKAAAKPTQLPLANFVGDVSTEFQQKVGDTLSSLPDSVQSLITSGAIKVVGGSTLIAMEPSLAGVRPRGWPEGRTWDHADGMARGNTAYGAQTRMSILLDRHIDSDRVEGALRHELGHAVAHHFGLEHDKGFEAAHLSDIEAHTDKQIATHSYLRQPGQAGRSEAIAEGLAELWGGGAGSPMLDDFPASRAFLQEWLAKQDPH